MANKIEEQNDLRLKVKELKYIYNISYMYIADNVLQMNYRGFLNWLSGNYNFGREKKENLTKFIEFVGIYNTFNIKSY